MSHVESRQRVEVLGETVDLGLEIVPLSFGRFHDVRWRTVYKTGVAELGIETFDDFVDAHDLAFETLNFLGDVHQSCGWNIGFVTATDIHQTLAWPLHCRRGS